MPFHVYKTRNCGAEPRWFGIRLVFDDDRWVSTCREVDADGDELAEAEQVAPRFYGINVEQAHRKMVEALENTFDEVTPAREGARS